MGTDSDFGLHSGAIDNVVQAYVNEWFVIISEISQDTETCKALGSLVLHAAMKGPDGITKQDIRSALAADFKDWWNREVAKNTVQETGGDDD